LQQGAAAGRSTWTGDKRHGRQRSGRGLRSRMPVNTGSSPPARRPSGRGCTP